MKLSVILLVATALSFAGCGNTPGGPDGGSTNDVIAVEALVERCGLGQLDSMTVVTRDGHGSPSAYIGVCADGRVIAVDD